MSHEWIIGVRRPARLAGLNLIVYFLLLHPAADKIELAFDGFGHEPELFESPLAVGADVDGGEIQVVAEAEPRDADVIGRNRREEVRVDQGQGCALKVPRVQAVLPIAVAKVAAKK